MNLSKNGIKDYHGRLESDKDIRNTKWNYDKLVMAFVCSKRSFYGCHQWASEFGSTWTTNLIWQKF